MSISVLNRLQKRSVKDIYLYINEKIVKRKRKFLYNRTIMKKEPSRNYYQLPSFNLEKINKEELFLAESFCKHVYDLLGSGPKKVCRKQGYDIHQLQIISEFKLQDIIDEIRILNSGYKPIEWQLDFKNDYLFSERQKSDDIQNSESNGYDIKIPWELARCQHLPFLARIYRTTGNLSYKNEILCEILDFITFNPIGYGVNWKCTMDVGIRVVNWIMALDLISSGINEDTDQFVYEVISKSIYQHCVFIRYHLEDYRDYRGNHYLSNIVGLLFSSLYFYPKGQIKRIQEFAIKQLFCSINEQFYMDGGNFESSLPYHRLALEMVIYGIWRILLLADCNDVCYQCVSLIHIHKREVEKLGKAFRMLLDSIKPNGNIYQLGDNDSGHLLRFYHFGEYLSFDKYVSRYGKISLEQNEEFVWDENELSCSEIECLINTILKKSYANSFFSGLFGNVFQSSAIFSIISDSFERAAHDTPKLNNQKLLCKLPYQQIRIIKFSSSVDLHKLNSFYYSDFGLVGLKSDSFYLGISLTDAGQNGRGGHSHNDKLSFELFVDGTEYERDPGTYVYTESREWRNKFRSSLAHNSPYFGDEQNQIGNNCFELRQRTICKLIELKDNFIKVSCKCKDIYVIRTFELFESKIVINDYSNAKFVEYTEFGFFSNGYGKIQKRR
ncbi:heparinase II/III family protein [Eubacterium limosum]|jgi:hypothetical protein|uniref:Heparin-sulfate lyase N-terminal domain-containing protein n=1 Tax=Eubacterium limosum TaxID=1736 RepID=A0AAC9QTB1_EUBLI|nr:heparinase II/III family protein [Eubacterium limosum]ARD65236.1 hypothetical protein B2M23_06640 [Eubacterium limosum]PWW49663.1 heparinase II/III-like protein [Eubacterium limosum]UQZ20732.1 heparinase II/III family protein [Eubacterium limosum]